MSGNDNQLRDKALLDFIETIEATGGVDNEGAPIGDSAWKDLGSAYISACKAIGRKVMVDEEKFTHETWLRHQRDFITDSYVKDGCPIDEAIKCTWEDLVSDLYDDCEDAAFEALEDFMQRKDNDNAL